MEFHAQSGIMSEFCGSEWQHLLALIQDIFYFSHLANKHGTLSLTFHNGRVFQVSIHIGSKMITRSETLLMQSYYLLLKQSEKVADSDMPHKAPLS